LHLSPYAFAGLSPTRVALMLAVVGLALGLAAKAKRVAVTPRSPIAATWMAILGATTGVAYLLIGAAAL